MLNFLISNGSTILVGAVVLAVIVLVAAKMIWDKRNGKSSCGCNCGDCPSNGACHTK